MVAVETLPRGHSTRRFTKSAGVARSTFRRFGRRRSRCPSVRICVRIVSSQWNNLIMLVLSEILRGCGVTTSHYAVCDNGWLLNANFAGNLMKRARASGFSCQETGENQKAVRQTAGRDQRWGCGSQKTKTHKGLSQPDCGAIEIQ